jgi:hypothetical protein
MINDKDSIYKKHEHCEVNYRLFDWKGQPARVRLYCIQHKKWLHTFTDQEVHQLGVYVSDLPT